MTDLERLKETLAALGIRFQVLAPVPPAPYMAAQFILRIAEGDERTEFLFDGNQKCYGVTIGKEYMEAKMERAGS